MISVGVDPGVEGGIVSLGEARSYAFWRMPTQVDRNGRRRYDLEAIRGVFEDIEERAEKAEERLLVTVERSQAFPSGPMGGAIANFQRGVARGFEWMLVALRIEHQLVMPQAWQREMLKDVEDKGDTKERALAAARKLLPGVDLRASERSIKPHPGLVDALLIASFGRWKALGSILEPAGIGGADADPDR